MVYLTEHANFHNKQPQILYAKVYLPLIQRLVNASYWATLPGNSPTGQ